MNACRSLAWIGLLLLLFGCATMGARTEELLAKDYATMTNDELRTYYMQLNDQIARVERAAGGGWTNSSVDGGRIAGELRDRRNEVRSELSRRGVPPY